MGRSTAAPSTSSGQRVLIFRRIITTSQTLTLPAGYYDIIAIGAGGSGGACGGANPALATGGGGPAWARDFDRFDSPTAVTFTLGAPGAGRTTSSGALAGNDGGTTTVTGNKNPITLTGGKGGAAASTGTTVSGGLGGAYSGGKIGANGSRGGNISNGVQQRATGGGAVDLFMLGSDKTRGGDHTSTNTTVGGTGGGGVGGRGGDITGSTALSGTNGGGAGGDSADNAQVSGPSITGVTTTAYNPSDGEILDILMAFPGLRPCGAGSANGVAPAGGGSGGLAGASGNTPLGATGGSTSSSGSSNSGLPAVGGGSGGAASLGTAVSSNGSSPICIVSVYVEKT